jgi:hypothetical protein
VIATVYASHVDRLGYLTHEQIAAVICAYGSIGSFTKRLRAALEMHGLRGEIDDGWVSVPASGMPLLRECTEYKRVDIAKAVSILNPAR